MTWVELCCGSAAVTLRLLGCKTPPAPYMGGKRRYARSILDMMGVHRRPGRVVLCDQGPWGRAWNTLLHPVNGPKVPDRIAAMKGEGEDLFRRLADSKPPRHDAAWCATFLALQAGNFSAKPVERDGDAWVTHGYANISGLAVDKGFTERLKPAPLAERVARVVNMPWPETQVLLWDAAEVMPIPGATVYIDPPYAGTTGYRADIDAERIAQLWADAGCHVAVSEARPLDIDGWHSARPAAHGWQSRSFGPTDEFITSNRPLVPQAEQMEMLT